MGRESSEYLSAAGKNLSEARLVVDGNGKIIEIDDAFCILTGYGREELLGAQGSFPFCPGEFVPEESLAKWWEAADENSERGMIFQHKDGSILFVRLISRSPVKEGEHRWIVLRYGSEENNPSIPEPPLCGGDKASEETDRIECRRLISKYVDRLPPEALAHLLADVVHDFNNIIYGITSLTTLALMDVDRESRTKTDLEAILGATEKASTYIQKLHRLVEACFPQMDEVSMEEILSSLTWLLGRAFFRKITIDYRPPDRLPPLRIDREQIENSLLTICLNTVKQMPPGGALTLEAEMVELSETDIDTLNDLMPGRFCRIRVMGGGAELSQEEMND